MEIFILMCTPKVEGPVFMIWILASSQGCVHSSSASAGLLFFIFSCSLLIIASTSQLKNTHILNISILYIVKESETAVSQPEEMFLKHYNKSYKISEFPSFFYEIKPGWISHIFLSSICLSLESHRAPFWHVWTFCTSSATWFNIFLGLSCQLCDPIIGFELQWKHWHS